MTPTHCRLICCVEPLTYKDNNAGRAVEHRACTPGAVRALADRADLPACDVPTTAAWGRRDYRVRQHPSQARAAAERGDGVFAATCGDTPPLTLLRLGCADDNDVRGAAGANPGLPVGHLPALTQDSAWKARQGAARNLLCPPALLEALSDDEDHDVRSAVAANRACPEELLRGIHQHRPYEFDVLEALSSTPADVLRTLAGDDSDSFRANIAANPSCPPEMAAALPDQPSA